jgi:uncharacterized protein (TIGR02246 family)
MRPILRRSWLAVVAVIVPACAAGGPGAEATREGVAETNRRFVEAAKAMDAAALAGLYTEDGVLLPPNGQALAGRIAIKDFWLAALSAGVAGVELQTTEVIPADTLAIEVGTFTMLAPGGSVLDQGKYLVVLRLENGHWLIHRDIWNTSLPLVRDTVRAR